MKKLIFMLTIFLLPTLVFATEYEVSNTPVKIDIPDSFAVFTLDNYQGNKQLEQYDISETDMKFIFDYNSAYLYAYNTENKMEIFAIKKYSAGDFRKNSNSKIEKFMEGYISRTEKNGLKITNKLIQEINGLPFLCVEYNNETIHDIDYVTLINNEAYIYKFQTSSSFNAEKRKEIESIMSTVSIQAKEVKEYNILTIMIVIILVVAGILFIVKRKIDKTKCPACKLKITSSMDVCPRCGRQLKNM